MKLPIYVASVDPCLFKQVKGLSKMAVISFTGAAGALPHPSRPSNTTITARSTSVGSTNQSLCCLT